MKRFILAIVLLGALSGLAFGSALAYEFSDYDRAAGAGVPLTPFEQQSQRDAAAQSQARQQSQENDRLHNQIPQFNPSQHVPNASWNLYQNGRTSVCSRGANNAVYCN